MFRQRREECPSPRRKRLILAILGRNLAVGAEAPRALFFKPGSASLLLGDEARTYLARAANTYSQLKSFQAETVVERRSSYERSIMASFTLFFLLQISCPSRRKLVTIAFSRS